MNKALRLTKNHFESSSSRTPEYLAWHRAFKREFTDFLVAEGISDIYIGKPNHFDMSGFFTVKGQAWYFSISDLRWSKEKMLVRKAVDHTDYSGRGGHNQYVVLDHGLDMFTNAFQRIVLDI